MKRIRKVLLLVTTCVMMLSCFAGLFACGPKIIKKQSDEYEVNINLDKNVSGNLTIMVPNNLGDSEINIVKTFIKGFTDENHYPNVKVTPKYEAVSDTMYMDAIASLVQTGKVPDLVYTNTAMYYYLVSKNVVLSLEPYYNACQKANAPKDMALDMADYYEQFLGMASYEGKRYIMPKSADTVVLAYNKEMLKSAGIDYTTDERITNDWTWENFVSVCEDLVKFWDTDRTKYKGYYCFNQNSLEWESVWNPIMKSLGASAYTDGKVSIDSQAGRKFAELYKELVDKKIVPSWNDGVLPDFFSGTAAFAFTSGGPSELQKYDELKDNFDYLPFPLVGGETTGKIGSGFSGWGISSTSENRDLAWAFLRYIISEEGQLSMYVGGATSVPSILRDVTESKAWAKGFEKLNLEAYTAHEECKISPDYFKGFDPSHSFDIQYALQAFTRNCLTNTVDIDTCISKAKTALEKAIREL